MFNLFNYLLTQKMSKIVVFKKLYFMCYYFHNTSKQLLIFYKSLQETYHKKLFPI